MDFQKYVGIPYKELDCYALVRKVLQNEFNISVPDLEGYRTNPEAVIEYEKNALYWGVVEFGAQPGDVVILGVLGQKPKHVGIYIGYPYVLHTSRSHGSLIHEHNRLKNFGYTDVTYYRFKK